MLEPKLLEYFFSGVSLPENAAVLDVGCQSAATLKWIKKKYDLAGTLIGIDKYDKNFENAEAQREVGVSLLQMDASQPLDFPDERFDLIFHCNTLECITDIAAHILDLYRLLKKGGIIVCIHRDWESIVINGSNKDLINKTVHGYANFLQTGWMDACDGWIGRRVWGYFNGSGLFDGAVSVYNSIETEFTETSAAGGWRYIHDMKYFLGPGGFLTEVEYAELIADMNETYARGQYLYVSPYYVYIGRKK